MKALLIIMGCVMSFVAAAEARYIPPTELTATEIKQAKVAMEKNKTTMKNYWQSRLAMAKENDKKLAQQGAPLQKPYYGDYKMKH
jgi:phage-related minor tail protein